MKTWSFIFLFSFMAIADPFDGRCLPFSELNYKIVKDLGDGAYVLEGDGLLFPFPAALRLFRHLDTLQGLQVKFLNSWERKTGRVDFWVECALLCKKVRNRTVCSQR